MVQVEEFYRAYFQLEDETLIQYLLNLTEIQHLRKGELLCREGEVPTKVTFLLSGLLRGYFLDVNGREITDCFAFRRGMPAMACMALGEVSSISIEALSDSEVLNLPMADVLTLMEENPRLFRTYSLFLLESLRCHWEVKTAMYQYTAMQRYQWFLRAYPGLIEQVSGKHIASFLGMTQVTLSRLRRALREDKEREEVLVSNG